MMDMFLGAVAMLLFLLALGWLKAWRGARPSPDEQVTENVVIVKSEA